MHVGYVKSQQEDNKSPLKGLIRVTSACRHDIGLLFPKGMCSESRDLFKFLEIIDNISEAVQDTDMVAMKV